MKLNNAQKFVFTSLLVVILLDFGSFTKLQTIWGLAFNANVKSDNGGDKNSPQNEVVNASGRVISTTPDGHNGVGIAGAK